MKIKHVLRPACFALGMFVAFNLFAELKLSPPFSDNTVLQRGMQVPVWGQAEPNIDVTVSFKGQSKTAKAGADGKWTVKLDSMDASADPSDMVVSSPDSKAEPKSLTIKGLLVGEVWVCSGQSNMQFTLKDASNAATELPLAENPRLRFCNGKNWVPSSPKTAADFSAIGYFFAKEVGERLGVPVGMINASVGGTPVQAWTSEKALRAIPELKEISDRCDANRKLQKEDPKAFEKFCAEDSKRFEEGMKVWRLACAAADVGMREKWFSMDTLLDKWDRTKLPMVKPEEGLSDLACVWFLRDLEIPAGWTGKQLILNLPGIDDVDITYLNGQELARTWYDSCKDFWKVPRHYKIPAEQVKDKKLRIVLMVMNVYGIGGVFGKPEEMSLSLADDTSVPPLPLAGEWLMRRGSQVDLKAKPQGMTATGFGGGLYDALIAPLQPYGIKGAIWYQGENNAEEPELYKVMFPAMIRNWRDAWGQGDPSTGSGQDFPFYFVSLAGYMGHQELAVEKFSWAEIREAQNSGLSLPHTGVAMAYDIGDANDIHPRNKADVGHRLALLALANDYGVKTECQGPVFDKMEAQDGSLRIFFTHTEGLAAKGGELKSFAVAGEDKVFHIAKAVIKDNTVLLTAADGLVPKPVAARYAWASIPSGNLYNSAGLPAVPFRTDNWQSDTIGTTGPGCR